MTGYLPFTYDIVYPRGYVTCFSETPCNTVMWGNYADKHKGICLKFEMDDHDVQSYFDKVDSHQIENDIYKVNYISGKDYIVKRNFFNDLWCTSRDDTKKWYTGLNGVRSAIQCDADNERQYNELFEKVYTRKTSEWKYEKEYRLLFNGDDVELQNPWLDIPFDKSCLRGVIFGMETPLDTMAEIEAVVEEGKYSGIEFEQAFFNDNEQKINLAHIMKDAEDFEKYKYKVVNDVVQRIVRKNEVEPCHKESK